MRRALDVAGSLLEWLIRDLPGGLGRRVRGSYWRRRLKRLGRGAVIDSGVRIFGAKWVSIGDRTWIDHGVTILAGPPAPVEGPMRRKPNPGFRHDEGEVVIGDRCHIAIGAILQGHGGLAVGNDSTVAAGCLLYSLSHHHSNPNDPSDRTVYKFSSMADSNLQSLIASPVVLEEDTALGLNSVVLPGGWIRKRSWVAVQSTVLGEIPEDAIAAGSPAKVIKKRFE